MKKNYQEPNAILYKINLRGFCAGSTTAQVDNSEKDNMEGDAKGSSIWDFYDEDDKYGIK